MTTIATDGKTMAGDGLVTSGSTIFGHDLQKVKRLPDGRIVGCAGSGYNGVAFMDWLESGGDKPKLGEDFEAIVLHPDGSCFTYDESCVAMSESLPTATGSGRQLALAAMDLGKTPAEAVEYAATRDMATGGVIRSTELQFKLAEVA